VCRCTPTLWHPATRTEHHLTKTLTGLKRRLDLPANGLRLDQIKWKTGKEFQEQGPEQAEAAVRDAPGRSHLGTEARRSNIARQASRRWTSSAMALRETGGGGHASDLGGRLRRDRDGLRRTA